MHGITAPATTNRRPNRGKTPVMPPPDVDGLRAETPGCAHRIHFNNAGCRAHADPCARRRWSSTSSSKPGSAATRQPTPGPPRSPTSTTRRRELLGCAASNVAFTANATHAFSRALSSIPFERGDVDPHHPQRLHLEPDRIPVASQALRCGGRAACRTLPEGGVDLDAMAATDATSTGRGWSRPPTSRPTPAWSSRSPRSAATAASWICSTLSTPANRSASFRSTSRRSAATCSPRRAASSCAARAAQAFLYVSDRVLERGYEPLFIDMRGARWIEPGRYEPVETAARFEDWEFPYATVLGCAVAVRYALAVGLDAISPPHVGAGRAISATGSRRSPASVCSTAARRRAAIVTFAIEGRHRTRDQGVARRTGINSPVSLREYAQFDFGDKGVDVVPPPVAALLQHRRGDGPGRRGRGGRHRVDVGCPSDGVVAMSSAPPAARAGRKMRRA